MTAFPATPLFGEAGGRVGTAAVAVALAGRAPGANLDAVIGGGAAGITVAPVSYRVVIRIR